MASFEVTTGVDPFLSVSLGQGEHFIAISKAMVSMSASITLKGKLQGGLIRSLVRKNAQGESAFLQQLEAPAYPGKALISPTLPGDIKLVDVEPGKELLINDGCFLACTSGVGIHSSFQSANKALFAGTGGFVIMKATGTGTVAISGYGSIQLTDLRTEEAFFDHSHIVAWESSLKYEVTTLANASGPLPGPFKLLSGLFRSATSGEGLVNKFSGNGKVYVCSRNREDLLKWIRNGLGMKERAK